MTNAYAYERSCWRGTVPPDIAYSNPLDRTFIHYTYLYPIETTAVSQQRVSMNLTVLTT